MAGATQAGVTAGAPFGPWGAAFGGVAGALVDMQGGGGASATAPQNASSAVYGSGLDGSQWNVNFSGVQSASSAQDKRGGVPGLESPALLGGPIPSWAWLAVAGLLAWKIAKSRR